MEEVSSVDPILIDSVDPNLLLLACTATVVIAKSSGLAADLAIRRELL
jgi:hypothetical protein